jgi:uncharacterized ferredoxin-like protein
MTMREAIMTVAGLMALAARTAPKAHGKDFVEVKVVSGEEMEHLAAAMEEYGRISRKTDFDRDAAGVRRSEAVLLLSLKDPQTTGLNCGACGYATCAELTRRRGPEFDGPVCAWRLLDLGIAIGSAVKTAGLLNADNRVMYRVGVVARRIGLIAGEIVVGIPLSATGKNIYFDRSTGQK